MAENIFPYELPANWQWATLGNVCSLSQGEKLSAKKSPYLNVKYLRGTDEKILSNLAITLIKASNLF